MSATNEASAYLVAMGQTVKYRAKNATVFACGYTVPDADTLPDAECSACKGRGEIDCECMDCGDTHTRECSRCHGDGVPEALPLMACDRHRGALVGRA